MRIGFEVPEQAAPGIVLPLGTRAIVPLVGGCRNFKLRNVFDPGNAPQTIADNLNLRVELRVIAQLLEITTAAATKVRAWRFNSEWRRLRISTIDAKATLPFT